MIPITEDNRMLGYELLGAYPNISHFVTTRSGGYSKEAYATFNCSPFCGDDPEKVRKNQQLLCSSLPCQQPFELVIPRQIHGTKVCVIDQEFLLNPEWKQQELLSGIDAVVTHVPGFCVCVSTADCVPLLLCDSKNKAVAAIHAGWQGTVEAITTKVLALMNQIYGTQGQHVTACIGPSISQDSFEVGKEVYETFKANAFDMQKISFQKEKTGKYYIDLWESNRMQLLAFGVPDHQIETAEICTYIHHDIFFSARRLGIQSGRILSGIMINR